MVNRPRFLVACPLEDGWQTVLGARRYMHGGDRYRAIADAVLAPHGEVTHVEWTPSEPDAAAGGWIDPHLPDADALVLAPWLPWPGVLDLPFFDQGRLDRAADLRVIAGTFDFRLSWVDLDAAGSRDVTIVDTSRTMTPTVAEFGVAITLALLRDIPGAIDTVRAGEWPDAPKDAGAYVFRDLADCRVGLAGYGTINRHYRRFVEPFGCTVTIYDPHADDAVATADGVRLAESLVALARSSDILVVAIPPTPSTLGVIDADVIDALAPGSLFVLLSRMAVVEQQALWNRVQAGELRAAVDVYDPEPPVADAWFRRDPNVLPTPHIAGNTQFAHERCFREACLDAVRVVSGEAPRNGATVRDKALYEGKLAAASTTHS